MVYVSVVAMLHYMRQAMARDRTTRPKIQDDNRQSKNDRNRSEDVCAVRRKNGYRRVGPRAAILLLDSE